MAWLWLVVTKGSTVTAVAAKPMELGLSGRLAFPPSDDAACPLYGASDPAVWTRSGLEITSESSRFSSGKSDILTPKNPGFTPDPARLM
jgi:hypothetical protein